MRLNRYIEREAARPIPGHNICGVLVHVDPVQLLATADALAELPGVEIAEHDDDGRFVLLVEDVPGTVSAVETIARMPTITGVASVSLVYHHCDAADEEAAGEDVAAKEAFP